MMKFTNVLTQTYRHTDVHFTKLHYKGITQTSLVSLYMLLLCSSVYPTESCKMNVKK